LDPAAWLLPLPLCPAPPWVHLSPDPNPANLCHLEDTYLYQAKDSARPDLDKPTDPSTGSQLWPKFRSWSMLNALSDTHLKHLAITATPSEPLPGSKQPKMDQMLVPQMIQEYSNWPAPTTNSKRQAERRLQKVQPHQKNQCKTKTQS